METGYAQLLNEVGFVNDEKWLEVEKSLAALFGFSVKKAEALDLIVLRKSIKSSVFNSNDILSVFTDEHESLLSFFKDLFRTFPEETEQIAGEEVPSGSLANASLLYLYAKDKPDLLIDYLQKNEGAVPPVEAAKRIKNIYATAVKTS